MSINFSLGSTVDSNTSINNLGESITVFCKYFIFDEVVFIEKNSFVGSSKNNFEVTLDFLKSTYSDAIEIMVVINRPLSGIIFRCGNYKEGEWDVHAITSGFA